MIKKKTLKRAIKALELQRKQYAIEAHLFERGLRSEHTERSKKKYGQINEAIQDLTNELNQVRMF